MAGNRPKTLTGSKDWRSILSQLRQALALGITERRISDEFFVFDLLKGVYEDGVDEVTRIELLTFLEEHSSLLIEQENGEGTPSLISLATNYDETVTRQIYFLNSFISESNKKLPSSSCTDTVLASLLDIFQQGRKTGSSVPFTCQVLTTLISVIIEFDQLWKSVEVCGQVVVTLLTLISQVNDATELLLRSHACTCLLEIEITYPSLLKNKLYGLYLLMKSEGSWLYQDYVLLFTTTLQHSLAVLAETPHSATDSKLTDILNRKEQIKECPDLKTPFYSKESVHSTTSLTSVNCFDKSVEAKEIRQIVSLLMENSLMFTPSGLSAIVQNLIRIVCQIPALSPIIFKPLVLQHLSSMDPSLLQLVFMLRRSFPDVLLSEVEEMCLLEQFIVSLNHPGYTAAHRLLLYEWFFQYDLHSNIKGRCGDGLPSRLLDHSYSHLFPSVFDGVDTQVVKLRALNLCLHPGPESDLASAVLMSSLVYLHKTVQHNSGGRAAVALFRVLYCFHKKHLNSSLPQDIKQFVIGLVSNSIQLVPYVINFMNALKELPNSSSVYLEILSGLHRQVVQASSKDINSQLEYVIQVLKKAATEKQINPKMTLNFVQRLLDTAPPLLQGDWAYGNAVLAVGRNILQYHSTDLIFHDMGRLFHAMMTEYEDVDVKDKARFYYALLTGAADEKIGLVLTNSTSQNGTTNNNLHNIVSGPGGILDQTTLTELEKSPVCWKRMGWQGKWEPKLEEVTKRSDIIPSDAVNIYLKNIKEYSPSLEYGFKLKMVDNCDFDQLLALTVQIGASSNWEPVKQVHVSCLLASEERELTLDLIPKLPIPTSFTSGILFTSSDSRTYFSYLEPLEVSFMDFFFPLPVTLCSEKNTQSFFTSLWERIVTDKSKSESSGVQSVYVPSCGMVKMETLIQNKLSKFIVNKSDEVTPVYLIGILLPAQYHLLMRIEQVEDRVVINTATDLWTTLTQIQTFLDQLCTGDSKAL